MNKPQHPFGGRWTEQKLEILEKYLRAWLNIFHRNEKAKFFKKVYVDAFAGTGYRNEASGHQENDLFQPDVAAENETFLSGSVERVMQLDPGFDEYVFVDAKKQHTGALAEYSEDPRVTVACADANHFLCEWVKRQDWRTTRAVVFLDPYGMQVDWETLEALARTQAVDLWVLFPLGGGVNRMLTRGDLPPENWQLKLTRFFGTDEWKTAFYRTRDEDTLFGTVSQVEKIADLEAVKTFFIERLERIFPGVAANPARLLNSRKNPIYLFCFASANPDKADLAIKISQHILKGI